MSKLFKGIALFTPAGDLIYAIDPSKQGQWHAHLCVGLQELLGLPEPPHFLVPAYTATVDRWFDPKTKQVQTIAEAYPAVMRYQTLLNAVFATEGVAWQRAEWREEACEPLIIESYRDRFPQLWEEWDLVVAY
ncbi:MAG: circadian clock protein KaiB, partial [Spirulina sp.]